MNTLPRSLKIGVAILVLSASTTWAQNSAPAFQNLRFNEDYSQYSADSGGSVFDRMKKIEINDRLWLSFGGEVRTRLEVWDNFGFSDANDDTYLLYRTFLHADLHVGDHWRMFVQGRFAGLTDRDLPGGNRAALDADYGDLWNAFVEAKYDIGAVNARFRLGRQELQYGKQRLISPLDWANNRRIFEGAVVQIKTLDGPWTADFWVTAPVIVDKDEFNERNDHLLFSGGYVTRKFTKPAIKGLDFYFLALNSINGPMVDHDRYTVGGRVWGQIVENLTYDVEGAYQFGDMGSSDISAYMITADLNYAFADTRFTPWIAAGAGYASGDDDPTDSDVETFNQLFPLGHAYLGFINAVGRQNIIDVYATAGFWPIAKKVRLKGDFHLFWLADDDDALYNAGGGVVRAGTGSESEVGSEIDLTLLYKINRHLAMLLGYSHFFAGDLIEDTGPSKDIDFFYTQLKFTF